MANNKEITSDIGFFKKLAQFRREGDSCSPDAFNEVARELFGMTVREAQTLYTQYRNITLGHWPYDERQEQEAIAIVTRGAQVLEHSMRLTPADKWRSIDSYMGKGRDDNDRNRIAVWARHEGREPQMLEMWLNSPKSLAMIHDMEQRRDVEVLCIVPWVDKIYSARQEDCLNDLGGADTMHVYEGDLFVLLNKGTDDYWNRPSENGVYVCRWGAYRRLLYTVGRGYLDAEKQPNVASTSREDDELGDVFCYDEHRWNHHLLTMDHKWKRIGNIHADVTLLVEKSDMNAR